MHPAWPIPSSCTDAYDLSEYEDLQAAAKKSIPLPQQCLPAQRLCAMTVMALCFFQDIKLQQSYSLDETDVNL